MTDSGVPRKAEDVLAVDRLIKMKSTSDVWTVIAECIKIWSSKNPTKWNSYLIELDDVKKTRKDKFASTTDKVTGGVLRYTVDLPQPIYLMIRMLYTDQELPMDTRFFHILAKKFPIFRVADKI